MPSLVDLPNEVLLLYLCPALDQVSLGNLRLTNSSLNDICTRVLFKTITLSIPEVHGTDWSRAQDCGQKLMSAPLPIEHTRDLIILNRCRPTATTECYAKSIPALRVRDAANNGEYLDDEHNDDNPAVVFSNEADLARANRQGNLDFNLVNGVFGRATLRSKGIVSVNQLWTIQWRHAISLSLDTVAFLLGKHCASLRSLEISAIGHAADDEHVRRYRHAVRDLQPFPDLKRLCIRAVDELPEAPPFPRGNATKDRLWATREIMHKIKGSLRQLRISDEHNASQIFTHTAIDRPLIFDHLLFTPTQCILHRNNRSSSVPITLELNSLELGWFDIQYLGLSTEILLREKRLVQIDITQLRRLVLENCFNVVDALDNLADQGEKGKLQLKEFALRHTFPPLDGVDIHDREYQDEINNAVNRFLCSFSGLELLAILFRECDEMSTYSMDYSAEAWSKHHHTLKVFVSDVRRPFIGIAEVIPSADGPYCMPGNMTNQNGAPEYLGFVDQYPALSLEEIGFNMGDVDQQQHEDYFLLRLLSQFNNLRAVHVRNIVEHTTWRDAEGNVTLGALRAFRHWANRIALPYYRAITDRRSEFYLEDFEEQDQKVAKFHRQCREARPATFVRPEKPKLRVIVVGDWGYRNLMNLAGPTVSEEGYRMNVGVAADDKEWDLEEPYCKAWRRECQPVFFEVEWEWRSAGTIAEESEDRELNHRHDIAVEVPGWRARVRTLEQTTVKGWPLLPGGEVEMLDFAWQD